MNPCNIAMKHCIWQVLKQSQQCVNSQLFLWNQSATATTSGEDPQDPGDPGLNLEHEQQLHKAGC